MSMPGHLNHHVAVTSRLLVVTVKYLNMKKIRNVCIFPDSLLFMNVPGTLTEGEGSVLLTSSLRLLVV